MSRFKLGLLLSALPAMAVAQTIPGPYVSGNLGAAFSDGSLRASQSITKIEVDSGFAGAAAAGWKFRNGLRAELQGGYQSNSVNNIDTRRVNGSLLPLANVGGHLSTYSVTANAIYDLPLRRYTGSLQPYIGAGLGYGWLDFNGATGVGRTVFHPGGTTYESADTARFGQGGAFAYQAIVGVAYPISRLPGIKLTAEYRYFGTARADVPVTRTAIGGNIVNGVIPTAFTRNGFLASQNILMMGLRYDFGGR